MKMLRWPSTPILLIFGAALLIGSKYWVAGKPMLVAHAASRETHSAYDEAWVETPAEQQARAKVLRAEREALDLQIRAAHEQSTPNTASHEELRASPEPARPEQDAGTSNLNQEDVSQYFPAEGTIAIPRFPIPSWCSSHKECVSTEQESYDALKVEWPHLTDDKRQKVLNAANRVPSMKYSVAEARARAFIKSDESRRPAPAFRY